MRTIPAGFRDGHATDLQACWRVRRRDGELILGTECDEDIPITTGALAGTYLAAAAITGSSIRSTDDLSVDNLEVEGALQEAIDTGTGTGSLIIFDLSASDIEAGMFDDAECTFFLASPTDPDFYQHLLRTGWLGNVTRDDDGKWKTEFRGLTQALSQIIVKTYGVGCQWELGDENCRVDLTPFTFNDVVDVAISRRQFQYPVGGGLAGIPPHLRPGAKITWTSGLNTGRVMEVKSAISLIATLFLPMPDDIVAGDTFTIVQACTKAQSGCIDDYDNINNYGGWGVFVPGETEVLRVGKR